MPTTTIFIPVGLREKLDAEREKLELPNDSQVIKHICNKYFGD